MFIVVLYSCKEQIKKREKYKHNKHGHKTLNHRKSDMVALCVKQHFRKNVLSGFRQRQLHKCSPCLMSRVLWSFWPMAAKKQLPHCLHIDHGTSNRCWHAEHRTLLGWCLLKRSHEFQAAKPSIVLKTDYRSLNWILDSAKSQRRGVYFSFLLWQNYF